MGINHQCLRQRNRCVSIFIPIIVIACFAFAPKASAQWTTSGSDISNTNSGNVGIGTSTPAAKLDLTSTAAGTVTVKIKGAASQTGNLLEFRTSDNIVRSYVNPAGALFFNPAMDQVSAAITVAPNFNGAYYATPSTTPSQSTARTWPTTGFTLIPLFACFRSKT